MIYVDRNASGPAHDGSSWCQALPDLQPALTGAEANTVIRVADGTYKPSSVTTRLDTFRLKSGVALFGGYAGCGAPDPDERNPAVYETILSGDLFNNDVPVSASTCCAAHEGTGCDTPTCAADVCAERPSCCNEAWDRTCAALALMNCCGTCGNTCDNSYHIVTGYGTDQSAVLDGFTITGGFANGSNPQDRGAAVFNYFLPGGPTISNCIIRRNVATGKGGGVYNTVTTATFTNCVFTGNVAPTGAAMANYDDANPTLINCTFHGNTAVVHSAGIWNVFTRDENLTLTNCILWGNAYEGGIDEYAQINLDDDHVEVDYSIIQRWTGLFAGVGNRDDDPLFADADGPDDTPGTGDDDLRLTTGSTAINTGDPGFAASPAQIDVSGQARLQGCRVDRGAYETDAPQMPGDFDADDAVTLVDYAYFYQCLSPAGGNPEWSQTCRCVFDDDGNGGIDLADFAAFTAAFSTP